MLARRIQVAILIASALLCLGASICYIVQPDSCAVVTFWPAWAWAAAGVLMTLLAWNRRGKRGVMLVVLAWLIFACVFSEEPRSIFSLRHWPDPEWAASRQEGKALRVVSLNCAVQTEAAADEVIAYHPDIVLLQEAPNEQYVNKLGRRLFGKSAAVVCRTDQAVIARGRVTASSSPRLIGLYAWARIRLAHGPEVAIFSVHLYPPVLRFDPWLPDCWKDYALNRRLRRGEMKELADDINLASGNLPVIVGGDFNAPGGDAVFGLMPPRLTDAFREASSGWPDTVINDFPVSRYDQIWLTREFRPASPVVRKTLHSDHRMVICDVVVR